MPAKHTLRLAASITVGLLAAPVSPAGAVTGTDLNCKKCVDTAELAKKSVSTAKLGNKAVTTAKFKDGAVTGDKLASAAVTDEKLAPGVMDDIDAGVDGAIAAYDQNGVKIGNVRYMPSPSIAFAVAYANGYSGAIPTVFATFLSGFAPAHYLSNDCSGDPYGFYQPTELVQRAVATTHPTGDGKVRVYVPKTDQVQNKTFMSTKSCSIFWMPDSNSWNIGCGCGMSTSTEDLMPLQDVFKVEDLIGPLVVR